MADRHPSSEKFHALLKEAGDLHDAKQSDYGTGKDPFANIRASEEFGVDAWIGSIMRGNDKMARIKSFIEKGSLKNESLRDSLMDLAVYSLISLVLYEESSVNAKS